MRGLRTATKPRQKPHHGSQTWSYSRSRSSVSGGLARSARRNAPWTTATASVRSCQARARDYNAAWQILDKGPLTKEPVGRAVVIGGGIAGLASALGLAKWGMSVEVYDRVNFDAAPGPETSKVTLTPNTMLALRSLGCNLTGDCFRSGVLTTGEVRGLDSVYGSPQAGLLPRLQYFTTYGHLKRFLRSEIDRIAPGRVSFHSQHTLLGHESVNVEQRAVSLNGPDGMKTVQYDLLVGADGVRSEVRKVLVKSDRSMKSEYGFVGPMRYVTATQLEVPVSWPSPEWQQVMQPAREPDVQEDPNGFLQIQGKRTTLASPIEVVGWPKAEWGERKHYRIRLLLFQDPDSEGKYCATLEGTPALFSELDETIAKGGGRPLRETIAAMFGFGLPDGWVEGLARAVMHQPIGFSMGGNVLVSKVATPELAPGITIVGDAAHAMTWRLGYSLETALDSAVELADSMFKAERLTDALASLNNDRLKEVSAMVKIDKVAPAFSGEEVPMGPLKYIIRTAIYVRIQLNKIMSAIGLGGVAPFPSYPMALQSGVPCQAVYKSILRETAMVTSAFFAVIFGFIRYFLSIYNANKYVFV
eukprot:jgi/Ulvmu1/5089/UM021_0106.1